VKNEAGEYKMEEEEQRNPASVAKKATLSNDRKWRSIKFSY